VDFSAFLLHILRYLCKQKVIYALEIVRQCLAFVWNTLDTTACQNKDLKYYLRILYQFNLILTFYEDRTSCQVSHQLD
jgi:hypothetical protein